MNGGVAYTYFGVLAGDITAHCLWMVTPNLGNIVFTIGAGKGYVVDWTTPIAIKLKGTVILHAGDRFQSGALQSQAVPENPDCPVRSSDGLMSTMYPYPTIY